MGYAGHRVSNDGAVPAFIITIDTEGDNLWSRPGNITTNNAQYLGRFQDLCEKYGFKPTYLTNYEMAIDPMFVRFARAAEERRMAEVGMHLHAWDSPPIDQPLTFKDTKCHPYLMEYPFDQIKRKVAFMTNLLEDTFGHRVTSHRAGRWGFDCVYARVLSEFGYLVDCSVTPYVSWASHMGDPSKSGGTDFRFFPDQAYLMDPDCVGRPGSGPLVEVPMTIIPRLPISHRVVPRFVLRSRIGQSLAQRLLPNDWLRPFPGNLETMRRVVRACLDERRPYAMFMTHSSELMPGGSPYFPKPEHIEELYLSLDALFSEASRHFRGMTLSEYARALVNCGQHPR
jgi:hypothetical protein